MVTIKERYRSPADLPRQIPVFPLLGAILLPGVTLPLTVFEPRYLIMLDDVMAGARVLAIVQPAHGEEESPSGKAVRLRGVGCVGRVTGYQELEQGRLAISLTGIARCGLRSEVETAKPYRLFELDFARFAADFDVGGNDRLDRQRLLATLKAYLEARQLGADWSAIARASDEWLVNTLAIVAPYGPEEKQALLEAADLEARADVLVALAEMELAAGAGGSGSTLQ